MKAVANVSCFVSSEIHPSILAQVRVVDLCLSSEEIRELMLTQLLQSECKKLLIRHLQLQNDKQSLQEKLVSAEVTRPSFTIISSKYCLCCLYSLIWYKEVEWFLTDIFWLYINYVISLSFITLNPNSWFHSPTCIFKIKLTLELKVCLVIWLISLDINDYWVIIFCIMNAVPTSCSLALHVLIYIGIWTK